MGLYPFTSLSALAGLPRNQERKIERLVEFVVVGDGIAVLDVACQVAVQ